MFKNLLPIGSVVRFGNLEQELMICGRIVMNNGTIYDYCGCLYPQGVLRSDEMYFFNRDGITECVFRGYENELEQQYQEEIGKIEHASVVDDRIVIK